MPLRLEIGSNVTWVNAGSAVTLRCVATSYPKATITWSRAGSHSKSEVLDHVRVLAELTISAVRRVHNGTYACMASNQRDMMVAAQDVVVLGEWNFVMHFSDCELIVFHTRLSTSNSKLSRLKFDFLMSSES